MYNCNKCGSSNMTVKKETVECKDCDSLFQKATREDLEKIMYPILIVIGIVLLLSF